MSRSPSSSAGSPAADRTYTFLHEEILSGRCPAGTRLKQEEIAERLGVSRIPVRDAIQRLLAEGFLTLQTDRGVTVTQLTVEDISDFFEIRAALEALVAKATAPQVDDAFVADAEELLVRMDRAREDVSVWIKRHEEFHEFLAASSGRDRLVAHVRHYRRLVEPYVRMYATVYHDPEMAGAEHRRLLAAMETRKAEEAQEAMVRHVMTAAQRVIDYLSAAPAAAGRRRRG